MWYIVIWHLHTLRNDQCGKSGNPLSSYEVITVLLPIFLMLDVSIPMTDLLCRMRFISLILLLLCHTHPTTISAGNHVSTFCVFSFCCFLVLDSICKWDNVVFAFLCLIYFTEHPTFWIHPCCYKWQDFIFYDCVCVYVYDCVCVCIVLSLCYSLSWEAVFLRFVIYYYETTFSENSP